MPDHGRFNARAYWRNLPPERQAEIGELAVLLRLSETTESPGGGVPCSSQGQALGRWMHAQEEACQRLDKLLPDPDRYPEGPDLAAIGIRTCKMCGCTDNSACEGNCSWVEEDLCSACSIPVLGAPPAGP